MASTNVQPATDTSFSTEVLTSSDVVLVDFWAEWCGPCRALAPKIESLAEKYAGKVKVYKMNVDENPGTPQKYGIRSIPTVILFKGGQPVEQLVGNLDEQVFAQAIEKQFS